jgi:hypothetical protein
MNSKTVRMRALNDTLRTTGCGGRVVLTRGIASLPTNQVEEILRAVQTFTDFNADDDPHGEHDFALLQAAGQNVMFKIDYYDRTMKGGSEDPSEANLTCRVLTILLAREY